MNQSTMKALIAEARRRSNLNGKSHRKNLMWIIAEHVETPTSRKTETYAANVNALDAPIDSINTIN